MNARRNIGVSGVVLAAIAALSGCSGPPTLVALPTDMSQDDLCLALQGDVAQAVLPGMTMFPHNNLPLVGVSLCTLRPSSDDDVSLSLAISSGGSMTGAVTLHQGLTDGSENARAECPQGSSLPAVTVGGEVESSVICLKDDTYTFEYHGKFEDQVLWFRANRLPDAGDITQADGQKWMGMIAEAMNDQS